MKKTNLFTVFTLLAAFCTYGRDSSDSSELPVPLVVIDRINRTPDYYQRDPDFGGFPGNGVVYCGPAAVSNSLIWLAQNGYPRIMTFSGNLKKDQHDLITRLASSSFINTGEGGSNPESICNGIQRYLEYCGYSKVKIDFYGWREVSARFRAPSVYPDLFRAKAAMVQKAVVLLNIGWYDHNERKDIYRRTGGHWVTMVGYGFNGKVADPRSIIIHDSETKNKLNDYIITEPVLSGTLSGRLKNLPRNASGYHRFKSGYKQYGVIEGMVIVEMPESYSLSYFHV